MLMIWLREYMFRCLKPWESSSDIESMIWVYFESSIVPKCYYIREEHRKLVCNSKFDSHSGTIVWSGIYPSLCPCIYTMYSTIIECTEIPYTCMYIEGAYRLCQCGEVVPSGSEEEKFIATTIMTISFPCSQKCEYICLVPITTIIDKIWVLSLYNLKRWGIMELCKWEVWDNLYLIFPYIIELYEFTTYLYIWHDECIRLLHGTFSHPIQVPSHERCLSRIPIEVTRIGPYMCYRWYCLIIERKWRKFYTPKYLFCIFLPERLTREWKRWIRNMNTVKFLYRLLLFMEKECNCVFCFILFPELSPCDSCTDRDHLLWWCGTDIYDNMHTSECSENRDKIKITECASRICIIEKMRYNWGMTTSETNTSRENRSLAQALKNTWRSGWFIGVVKEVVWEYLWIHANLSPNLQEALNQVNTEIASITAVKDSTLKEQSSQQAVPSGLPMAQIWSIWVWKHAWTNDERHDLAA